MGFRLLPIAVLLLAAGCATAPPPRVFSYRALGTEPFWSLTISERDIIFEQPNAPQRVVQPTPRAIIGTAGEIYTTPRIGVNIVHQRCSDGMSDRLYRDQVQVDIDGQRFNGCGGEILIAAELAGTSWRVSAVNGAATPPGSDYFISFSDKEISARFGCNRLGGAYRQSRDTLTAGPIMGTQMGCAEPAMRFEREGAAVLGRPMRMGWAGGDRLTLANEAGRIELVRSY